MLLNGLKTLQKKCSMRSSETTTDALRRTIKYIFDLERKIVMNKKIFVKALAMIAAEPYLIRKYSMPNINFPTMGGLLFWNDLARCNGWRMQQNTLTQPACQDHRPGQYQKSMGRTGSNGRDL